MVSLPADRAVSAGQWVTLTATSTDAACEWSQLSGTGVDLEATGLVARFLAPAAAGALVLRATDSAGSDDIVIRVTRAASRGNGTRLWGRVAREIARGRDVLAHPFATTSIWNVPIGDRAVYVPLGLTAPTNGYSTDDVHIVFTPGAPLRSLVDRGYWWPWTSGTSVPGTDTGVQVQVPDAWIIAPPGPTSFPNNATAALQADGLAREFQYTVRPTVGSNISISDAPRATFDLTGTGQSTSYGAHGGAGMTCIGGTIRYGELTSPDPIRHALAITMNMRRWGTQQGGQITNGYRWPAIAADAYYDGPNGYGVRGSGGKDGVGMGSLLAVPASVNLDTLGFETSQGAKIARAYQDYGAYVVDDSDDDGGNWDCHLLNVEASVYDEFPEIDTGSTNTAFKRDMDKVFTRLALVDNNAPATMGGGGVPRIALHPPLAGQRPTVAQPDIAYSGAGPTATADGANAVTSAAIPLASTTPGHYNIIAINVKPEVNTTDPGTLVTPAGWETIATGYDSGSPSVRLTLIGKHHAAADPITVSVTWEVVSSFAAASVAYANVSAGDPIQQATATPQAASSAAFPTGAITTDQPGWLITAAGCRTGGTWTMPDTTRTAAAVSSSVSVAISDTAADTAPGTHSRTPTFTASTSVGVAAIAALRPGAPPAAEPPVEQRVAAGFTQLVLDSNFTDGLDPEWRMEPNGSTYGANNNVIGIWSHSNVSTGPATVGTGSTLKLASTYDGTTYRAGMVQTRTGSSVPFGGVLFPRYAWYEFRMRIPIGKSLWGGAWLRHRHGASTCEVDISENFGGGSPGHSRFTVHRKASAGAATTTGLGKNNLYLQQPYEADGTTRAVPQWHTIACSIRPENGVPGAATDRVVFDVYIDGVHRHSWMDTSAAYWTGLETEQAFDICLQGMQIGGTWNGHPDDPIGYSRWINGGAGGCILSGTPPNECATSFNGVPIVPNVWDALHGTLEVDYVRVWKYTG